MTTNPNQLLEVEAKLYVNDLDAVAARLNDAGAELHQGRVYEHNIRYENADETLTRSGIVVRLRQDTRARLTYKEPARQIDEDIPTRFEAEVEVGNFDEMNVILERLGYHPHMTYEKYRTTYKLNGCEIVLDEMPYGHFVEIEGTPGAIRDVIAHIGLTEAKQYPTNYLRLFENVRYILGLDFQDLTFENFNGVDVPQSAFEDGAATRHALKDNDFDVFYRIMRELSFQAQTLLAALKANLQLLQRLSTESGLPDEQTRQIKHWAEAAISQITAFQTDIRTFLFDEQIEAENREILFKSQWHPFDAAAWEHVFGQLVIMARPYLTRILDSLDELAKLGDVGDTYESGGRQKFWRVRNFVDQATFEKLRMLYTSIGVDALVVELWQHERDKQVDNKL